jgi:hypothetical protein
MNFEGADGLEGHSRPACLKGPGTHVISASHNRGGKKKRILQRDSAQLCAKPVFCLGIRNLQPGLDFIMEPGHQCPDRHLMCSDTGILTGGGTLPAGILGGKTVRSPQLVIEPDTSQNPGRINLSAGFCTGGIFTQDTSDHVRPKQFLLKHFYLLLKQFILPGRF